MKRIIVVAVVIFTAGISYTIAQQQQQAKKQMAKGMVLKSNKDTLSYIIGRDIAMNLKRQFLEVDIDILTGAMKEQLAGNPSILSDDVVKNFLMAMQDEFRARMEVEQTVAGERNKEEGSKYLAENAKKPGVKVTPSGLQYRVITQGQGKIPAATDMVVAHYEGRLIDGKKFDSSFDRGAPFETRPDQVIKGWTEALTMMREGSVWEVTVPSELAYGASGAGEMIGPNAVLIFKIELIRIK